MPPVETWGKDFVVAYSRNSQNNDHVYVMANEAGTVVTLNGDSANAVTLAAGQVTRYYAGAGNGGALARNFDLVSASKPVLVLQLSTGGSTSSAYSNTDGTVTTNGDPAALIVSPTVQFLNDAIISTPATGFDINFVTIVAKTSDVTSGAVKLDGVTIPSSSFVAAGDSGMSIARVDISIGSHRVTSTNGLAAYVTGFGYFDAYAYMGGTGLVDLERFPGGVAQVGYRSVEDIGQPDSPTSGDVSRDVERTEPYTGPIVQTSPNQWQPGATVNFAGSTLTPIEKVVIDGVECKFTIVNGEIRVTLPPGIKPGTYDMKVSGDFGELTVQDAVRVAGSISAELIGKKYWTNINEAKSSVRVIYKNPVGEGKVQFKLNGKEIMWANAVDASDPKLKSFNVQGVEIPYLVRNVKLTPGIKNAFEIYLNGKRVWRAAYFSAE
jgi:hypothetical protein